MSRHYHDSDCEASALEDIADDVARIAAALAMPLAVERLVAILEDGGLEITTETEVVTFGADDD